MDHTSPPRDRRWPGCRPRTVADLLRRLGDLPPERVRTSPPIGTGTEADLNRSVDAFGIGCELVDGMLVMKAGREGAFGHLVASIATASDDALRQAGARQAAVVLGAILRCRPATIRRPDISVFAAAPAVVDVSPTRSRAGVIPDLIIDVHMVGNTPAEMARRRRDYFAAGITRVWSIHPAERTVTAYTDPHLCSDLPPDRPAALGDSFPGAAVTFRPLFDDLAKRAATRA